MNVTEIISITNDLNITLASNIDKLLVKGDHRVVKEVLPVLQSYKKPLLEYLKNDSDFYVDFYHETASIYEFDYGMDRQKAEHQAINEVVLLYSKNNRLNIGSKQTNEFINQFIKKVRYGKSR